MSVRRNRQRGGAWYVDVSVRQLDGNTRRVIRRAPVQTRRDAEGYERAVIRALADGSFERKEEPPEPTPTFSVFWKSYVATALAGMKPSTRAKLENVGSVHLKPALGPLPLDAIGPHELETLKGSMLSEGYAPKTTHNVLSAALRALRVAKKWGKLRAVPEVDMPRVPPPDFDYLVSDEQERLLAAAPEGWSAMIEVALLTGLRLGELRALKWTDVDLVAGRMLVRRSLWESDETSPKSNRQREVPLCQRALRAFKKARHLRGERVFCAPDGSSLPASTCQWALRRACRKAGLRELGWHALRHSFASTLVSRGVSLMAVKDLLGHGSLAMSLRYSHLSPDVRRDAVAVLDAPRANVTQTREAEHG